MKLISNDVQMSCTLVLGEKEVKMLSHLAGYGGETIARSIYDKITHEFSVEDWSKLWSEMRTALEVQGKIFKDTREVFRGTKRAMPYNAI